MSDEIGRIAALFEPKLLSAYQSFADVDVTEPHKSHTEPTVEWRWPEGEEISGEELSLRYLDPASRALAIRARENGVDPAQRTLEGSIVSTESLGRSMRFVLRKKETA